MPRLGPLEFYLIAVSKSHENCMQKAISYSLVSAFFLFFHHFVT